VSTPSDAAGPDRFVAVAPGWYVSNLGGVIMTGVVARRSGRPALRLLFAVAVGLHVGEAAYAYTAARRAGMTRSAPRWGLQTLAVGFPSLGALRAVIRETSHGEPTTTS
jgi:transmembrane protein TMEM254